MSIEDARRGRDLSSILRQARPLHEIRRIQMERLRLDAREVSDLAMKLALLHLVEYEDDELEAEHETLARLERENR